MAAFDCITAAQLRVLLQVLIIILTLFSFVDLVAEHHFIGDDQINQRATKEILLSTIHTHAGDKLKGFGFGSFSPDGPMIQSKEKSTRLTNSSNAKKATAESNAKILLKTRSTAKKKIA